MCHTQEFALNAEVFVEAGLAHTRYMTVFSILEAAY